MATEIRMPQFGVSMETGTIAKWFKSVGDPVKAGDVVASIETEKLTNDVISEVDGTILAIVAQEGEEVPIQGLMAVVGAPGEVWNGSTGETKTEPAVPVPAAEPNSSPSLAPATPGRRIKASPLARKTAARLGVDLAKIPATGTSGRIKSKDVYAYVEQIKAAEPMVASVTPPAAKAGSLELMEGDTVVKLAGMRKVVSQRMWASHNEIPPVTQNIKVDVTELMKFRKMLLAETGKKYSVNDLILKATAKCLRQHPEMLVSLDGDQIIQRAHVNLGMAVALDAGLIVPVIRDADKLSLDALSAEARDLATRAKENRLGADEYKGSTFTVSNLGMFGIETFTPIINQPDAAILGVCAIHDELDMDDEGKLFKKQVMRLSCTLDHRLLDGSVVAKFEMDLRDLLEKPMSILV